MKLQAFKNSLQQTDPPAGLPLLAKALWYDGRGDWERAHELVQDEPGAGAALVHAYLHRKEGDSWNADYWYRKAGRTRPDATLAEEWERLVAEMLPPAGQ